MNTTNRTRRRVAVAMILILIFAAVFVFRLVDIQVVRAASYNEASFGKMSIPETVFGRRGDIVDSTGRILATQEMTYNVTVSPRNAREFSRKGERGDIKVSPQQAATEIAAYTKQTPDEIIGIINAALKDNPNSDFAYLTKGVDVDTFKKLVQLNIPWLYFEQNPSRSYPYGAVAGNVLGYVGSDGQALAGLELGEDDCLGQTDGSQSYERGADGVRIPGSTVVEKAAKDGSTLKLTIDADIQWYAQQVLSTAAAEKNAVWAMAVVMEVKTGNLIAVADYPTYDPNDIDAYDPADLGSRAFTSPYEPGSTMKVLTTAMLLDSGKATPATPVYSPQYIEFPNGAHFKDWGPHPSRLTLEGVLTFSSNSGIAQLGAQLTPEERYDYMKKFGLGAVSGVDFVGESGGLLSSPDQWDNQSYYTMFFGQGLSLTAIQMASAYAAIGNGGLREPTSLVESCMAPDGTKTTFARADPVRVVSPEAARTTLDMMENLVKNSWLSNELSFPGYRIAAKTGTAEHSDGQGGYSNKFNVSLATIFPADNPQYVVLVTMSDPDGNSTTSLTASLRSIVEQVIKTKQVQPSQGSAPDFSFYY